MKKRWTAALLALCFVLSLAPYALAVGKPLGSAEPSVLYVSESGSNDKDGTSEENATTLDHATEIANDKGGPVQIVVVGIVSVDTWTSPTVETELVGKDEDAVLKFHYHAISEGTPNINLSGPLSIDGVSFDVYYEEEGITSSSPYIGNYVIVANGNPLMIGEKVEILYNANAEYNPDTERQEEASGCYIIGGGLNEDITTGTSVTINASVPVTRVYGGGYNGTVTGDVNLTIQNCGKVQHVRGGGYAKDKDATVTGNVNLKFANSVTDNAIYGGGEVGYPNKKSAAVTGKVSIDLSALNNGFGRPIYGGGCGETAPVGEVAIIAQNIDMTNNAAALYGGGYDGATVEGNVTIQMKDSTIASDTVWGGGNEANVNGNVSINILDSKEVIGDIHGGGEEGNVSGAVEITLTGGPITSCPDIFATGKGKDAEEKAKIGGDVSITLNGSRADVYTLGEDGQIAEGKSVTVTLDDTDQLHGAVRGNAEQTQYLYNYEIGNTENTVPETKVIVKGDYTSTGIVGFSEIVVQDGGCLREHQTPKTLFNNVGTVTIAKGGTLDLLQTNEITGAFTTAGTLKMPKPVSAERDTVYFIVTGTVAVSEGATYVSTEDNGAKDAAYVKGDVFLRSMSEYSGQTPFAVSETGKAEGYFTDSRTASGGGIQNEWFVDKTEPVIIQPADITVYMGGDGYESVVGDIDSGETTNSEGLPEPGFLFTVPDEINAALEGKANAVDLSKYLTFTYNDGQGTTRTWSIQPYTPDGSSTLDPVDGIARYVYRMVPAESQDPVRLTFTNDEGQEVVSDEFVFDEDCLNTEYTMALYLNQLDQGHVQANFSGIEGMEACSYPIQLKTGTLTVRGTTEEPASTEIVSEESEVYGNEVTAMAPADVTYYVNDSQVEITDKENVKLLVDDVLDTQVLTDYIAGMEDIPAGAYLFAVQYLDLVDTSNGNAVVTMGEGQKMTLYWPVPADADTAEPFYIVHFDALDRNYGTTEEIDGLLQANPPELYENLKPISIGNQQYIKFETGAFSPFALVYEKDTGGSGPSRPTYYTLTYDSNGGTQYDSERYRRNTVVQLDKVPTREGYTFTGWYADKELTQAITEIKMTSNKTVYAGWEETDVPGMLNGEDHYAYVVGYEDGTVRPGGNISRAEVATIFFRLLQDQVRQENLTTDNVFADVGAGDWYNTAISTMAELGILKGRTPDTFVPNAPITRAEFAAICARFDTGENAGGATFPDLVGHWAKEEVERAVSLGWIMGYEDNTFRPDKAITRAEAVTMINRVLQRNPQSPEDLLKDMVTWPDNQDPSQWYYLAIQEATNSHDYERTTGIYETWTQLRETPDWSQYE